MILGIVTSRSGVKIRLTDERWNHVVTSHLEINPKEYKRILKVVKGPEIIFKGDVGELLAVCKLPRKKVWIVVAYKEVNKDDGFILTAYVTTDSKWLFKREILWNKE